MLPFGTPPSKTAEQVNKKTMRSTVRNLTNDRRKVESFIKDEENQDRRAELTAILNKTQEIVDKFDGHRYSDMKESAEYKQLVYDAFQRIQNQRFSGRKIFFVKLSNPVFGFETSHFYWFLTKQGVQINQLDFMSDFINELKPTPPPAGMKIEPKEPKPTPSNLVNVPKSTSSKVRNKNQTAVYINHLRLREALDLYIKGILGNFKIPTDNVECMICTSELPDKLVTNPNILINLNLVYEDSREPLIDPPAVENRNCDEFGFWTDSSGDFDRSVEIFNANNNDSANNTSMRRLGDDIFIGIPTDNLLSDYWSKHVLNNNHFSILEPADQGNDDAGQRNPARILNSTPNAPRTRAENDSGLDVSNLPRPNESIIANDNDSQNILSLPLPTPHPTRAPLTRSASVQPVPMDPLLSEEEDGEEANQENHTMPARPSELDQIIAYMDRRFNFLEKSFEKK